MLDITAVVLTYNEELHIRRCLERLTPIVRRIYVVDCFSKDRTCQIAREFSKVMVVQHEWPGNQAEQFNWALDHLSFNTSWILRMDADEYITDELSDEMHEKMPSLGKNISAIVLPLRRAFLGRILKHGIVNGISMIRIFRPKKARYERRLMDEHLCVLEGDTIAFKHHFVDDSRIPLRQWVEKHNQYSTREMITILDAEYDLLVRDEEYEGHYARTVARKRSRKARYAAMPLFWRALAYFFYRYFLKLGMLDGKEGFLWDFLQGWWYRTLVDAKIYEVYRICGHNRRKIKNYLFDTYNLKY